MNAIRTLLHGIVDYAGLFPPASLNMHQAVQNYATYQSGPYAWMLGRFIVPVAELSTFEAEVVQLPPQAHQSGPWRLSALTGVDLGADVASISAFNTQHLGRFKIDAIELKVSDAAQVGSARKIVPAAIETFYEIPADTDPSHVIQAVAEVGGRAKVRTGGVAPEAFPSAAQLFRFISVCVAAGVPFKATAGLHHPLRSSYRLTYQADSPTGLMFGFLNVFLTAAFLHAGLPDTLVAPLLEENRLENLCFDTDNIQWLHHRVPVQTVAETRSRVALSFGSCSFTEPVDDLKAMQLL